MKKRIAICGNGWSNEFLKIVLDGARRCASGQNIDFLVFMNYSYSQGVAYRDIGEANIYRLLDYTDVDGIILLANTFNVPEEIEYLTEKIQKSHIPAVSLELQLKGIDYIGSDNYSGMYDMCNHIIGVHEVQKVAYVSGIKDNEENKVRRKALEDVLENYGLFLAEEDVICGDWNYMDVMEKLPVWLDERKELPGAIICANDVMAMAVCAVLKNRGIRVPEDVLVTGFDHLEAARKNNPKIATVDRNWGQMGYLAMHHLLDKIEGKETQSTLLVKSIGIPAKSCGCDYWEDFKNPYADEDNGLYQRLVNVVYWGGHLCDISESMAKIVADDELHERFNEFLVQDHQHEENELYICVMDDFFTTITGGFPLRKRGYTDTMDVICGIKNGESYPRVPKMPTGKLIPEYDENSEESHFYLFNPLYDSEGCYGYVVFANEISMMYDYTLYNWLRNVKQSIGNVRQNMRLVELNKRLSKLSLTDGLTGVYNRMGCEGVAYPFLERCHKKGKYAAMMFADINKMKQINDKYGHLQGDLAICTVARVIQKVLQKKWIIVRYGGDEFIMVGECSDQEQPQRLLDEITAELAIAVEEMQIPYNLKVGVGYVMISPDESLNLSDCLRRADEAMYLVKKKQHSEAESE